MDGDFLTKIVTALSKSLNLAEIIQDNENIKITSECVYCGRSVHGLPHLGIILSKQNDGKITGGVNCFRCGTSKSLKQFLIDFQPALNVYSVTIDDIHENVSVVQLEEKKINIDFKAITKIGFFEELKFYNWIRSKYYNDPATRKELRNRIILNLNAFLFLRSRLKLNFDMNLYNAYRILKEVKGRAYIGKNSRLILGFDSKFRYIFDKVSKESINWVDIPDERDRELFGHDKFPYVFTNYVKMKNPSGTGSKQYIIRDTNCGDSSTFDSMNVYVCEGVFDALSMKFYKNLFNLDEINRIEKNILNLYIAMGHTGIDRFISQTFLGISSDSSTLPGGITDVNFIIIPDTNVNIQRYVFSLYKFFLKEYNTIRKVGDIRVKGFYLDISNQARCHDDIKDVNDVINKFNRRLLRDIGVVEIF